MVVDHRPFAACTRRLGRPAMALTGSSTKKIDNQVNGNGWPGKITTSASKTNPAPAAPTNIRRSRFRRRERARSHEELTDRTSDDVSRTAGTTVANAIEARIAWISGG